MKTLQDFVEEYFPNYFGSDLIAEWLDLEEMLENDDLDMDEHDSMMLLTLRQVVYMESINGYIKSINQGNKKK